MPHFYRNSLICCLFMLLPGTVLARAYKDADAVVTMKNGQPCFSYPRISEIQNRPYSLSFLDVTSVDRGKAGWLTTVIFGDRKVNVTPDIPENCIEYGTLKPGMKEEHAATTLSFDTPYRVFMQVAAAEGYEQKFASEFCITKNEKDEPILVEAEGNGKGAWGCLKPGESKKRGLWEKLFGK